MSTSTWTGDISSDWADAGNWSPSGIPAASSDVVISIGDAVASASIGTVNSITDTYGLSFESAGTNKVTTFLDNTGSLNVDDSAGAGGTILNIGGTLTNRHRLAIGNATLSAPDEVAAAALDNTGSILLTGSSSNQALLDVTGAAGFGTAGVLSGYVRLAGDSAIEFAGGQITSLATNAQLHLNGNDAFIEDSTGLGSNSALTGLASIGARAKFTLNDQVVASTTGALANDGLVSLDANAGGGGSSLTLAGALTNSGNLTIGNSSLSSASKVTTTALTNTGSIHLRGSSANQALLDVTGAAGFGAAGILSGDVFLTGDSAIEFKSGEITSLAANAQLHLSGNNAFIEDGTTGSNSALTGLASIGARATFTLNDHVAVSTTGALVNDGTVGLDTNAGDGGSSLTLAGALTNSGALVIGNATLSASDKVTAAALDNTGRIVLAGSSANQALLDVASAAGFGAAGVLSGYVGLSGDSAIEFKSGEITSLAANAQLHLHGNDAFIEDGATGSNSALEGLASIGAGARFDLERGASVSTTGGLVNDGYLILDSDRGAGGSSLTLAGALTNSGSLFLGNSRLSASATATAASLDNTGSISLNGSGANQALLKVTGVAGFGATGTLTGNVNLNINSAIEFASGQITTIAAGAQLNLIGKKAVIEDGTTGSNSALEGLASIGGNLLLEKGAAVSTGALANTGNVYLDNDYRLGGSNLTVAGALTNSGYLSIGNSALSTSDEVTAASLDNTGRIVLTGHYHGIEQALLDVTGGAGFGTGGVLSGDVELFYNSAIEFTSGQISTIGAGSQLILYGKSAVVEDSTALGSNSALAGLANVSGSLSLNEHGSVSTTGSLVNDGTVALDSNYYRAGGSNLTVAGALTNTGALNIGNRLLSSSDSVTANSFVNSGTVNLNGYRANLAALDVSGATTNNGSISITSDTEEFAGAVGGAGSFHLNNANLRFNSSVSAGQTITETRGDALILEQAQSFAATIRSFGTGDTIDATNFVETATTYNFVENIAGTGGTLSLHDGGLTANIQMTGVYTKSDFTLAADSGTGTLVKFA